MKKQVIISLIYFTAAMFLTCSADSDSFILPMETPDTSLIIQNLSTSNYLLESGGDTCLISATVVNASGSTLEGIKVIFEVPHDSSGSISYPDDLAYSLSDSIGSVSAYYTSPDNNYGDFQITARSGTVSDSLMITVIPIITSIQLTANMTSIIGDGESVFQLSARPISTAGNVSDLGLYLSTDFGYMSDALVYTDSTGFAYGILHSVPTGDDISSVVRCWVADNPSKRDSISVYFLGISVQLATDSNYIQSSNDSTRVIALVSESTTSNPIPNKIVTWNTTLGNIGGQSITNLSGEAETYLVSTGISGSAQITANIGNGLAGSTPVIIVHGGASNLSMSASSASILANGARSSVITAFVTDATGNALEGIGVSINHSVGTITTTYGVTDNQGFTTFELVSPVSNFDISTTVT
ncbi:MAG: Ig-like domain-containing protein [Candidatus Marinimicrobia bacterium]|nr:Ig-like domain-containing protein [Candidatus Neomarinimicrobiota bacterium]